jgi:hypothetical protein
MRSKAGTPDGAWLGDVRDPVSMIALSSKVGVLYLSCALGLDGFAGQNVTGGTFETAIILILGNPFGKCFL